MFRKRLQNLDFIVLFLLLVSCLVELHSQVFPYSAITRKLDYAYVYAYPFVDVAILLSICSLFCLFRRRATFILSFILVLLWYVLNVAYSRLFNQYFPLHALGEYKNLDFTLICDYITVITKVNDILVFVYIILFLGIIFLSRKHEPNKLSTKVMMLLPIIACLTIKFLVSPIVDYIKYRIQPDFGFSINYSMNPFSKELLNQYCYDRECAIASHGIFRTQFGCELLLSTDGIQLGEDRIQKIDNFIKQDVSFNSNEKTRKNIVFIIVESFLSIPSDMFVGGEAVTPVLNRIRRENGTLYNGNVVSNIAGGESSDGQFIYFTGLLPLQSGVTIVQSLNKDFISLPAIIKDSLEYSTCITIPTLDSFWHQREMNVKYGIDSCVFNKNDHNMQCDSVVFDMAIEAEKTIPQPFFHAILTASMHGAYSKLPHDVTPWNVNFPDSMSIKYQNYLIECHYMDKHLGRYIEHLKEEGLYDNSIIVIVADHEAHKDYLCMSMESLNNCYLPIYIINSGKEKESFVSEKCNQIDVFPTILDIAGINSVWKGLGHSLVKKEFYSSEITQETQEISTDIIMSNFFSLWDK